MLGRGDLAEPLVEASGIVVDRVDDDELVGGCLTGGYCLAGVLG